MISGMSSPTQITQNAATGAQQNQDFWQGALQNGNFNAPYKQTPDASTYFQQAAQGNAGFLDKQAQALGGLVGNGGFNDPAMQQKSDQAFNRGAQTTQNSMGTSDYLKNLGIQSGNALNDIGIGNEVFGANQAFDQTQQTAGINAYMQEYQQQLKEQQEQQNQNNAMLNGLLGSLGKVGGNLLNL